MASVWWSKAADQSRARKEATPRSLATARRAARRTRRRPTTDARTSANSAPRPSRPEPRWRRASPPAPPGSRACRARAGTWRAREILEALRAPRRARVVRIRAGADLRVRRGEARRTIARRGACRRRKRGGGESGGREGGRAPGLLGDETAAGRGDDSRRGSRTMWRMTSNSREAPVLPNRGLIPRLNHLGIARVDLLQIVYVPVLIPS